MQTRPLISLENTAQAQEAEAILRACVHCGFCNAICPTYQLLGDERDGPRGRIYLIKQVLEGAAVGEETRQHLDRCLTCRACETTCPSGVRYGRLLDIGRAVVEQQVRRPWLERVKRCVLCAVLPYPQRFALLFRCALILKSLMPNRLRSKIPAMRRTGLSVPQNTHKRKMLVLAGCVQPILAPAINTAAARVLDKLGITLLVAPAAGCCGALSYHLPPAQSDGLDFMRRNIDAWLPFLDQDVEDIVMTASGCGLMVKEYGNIFRQDPCYAEKAQRISATTRDLVEVLAAEDLTSLKPDVSGTVAFQSPCTLQYGQHLGGAVEAVLRNLGFNLSAVANPSVCCGSAGTYSLLQPELSQRLLQNKVNALESAEPDVIATANIGCLMHIQSMTSIPVRHWIEILDAALGGLKPALYSNFSPQGITSLSRCRTAWPMAYPELRLCHL
jgi:glycolate oxidase iron-sulfur subunit